MSWRGGECKVADRTSAGIFGDIFRMLADDAPLDRDSFARQIWEMSQGYDFHSCQMDADDELVKLGLARRMVNPEHPDDGEVIVYRPKGDAS